MKTTIAPLAQCPPVCVIGLGYVGSVVAASLAARGARVRGVDLRPEVVAAINAAKTPLREPLLDARITDAIALGTLSASADLAAAVTESSIALVCVGTPVSDDGTLDVSALLAACEAVASSAIAGRSLHIVIRSTVPPGLYREALARLSARVGPRLGSEITLSLNPEFLREGSAVRDLETPEMIVWGSAHDRASECFDAIYGDQREKLRRCEPATAEMLKLACNAWHAVKVSFANEVSRVAQRSGVDGAEVMALLCADQRLNTSAAYLKPGMPFGGSCLVKDATALASHARSIDASAPLLGSVIESNEQHLAHIVARVRARGARTVAVLGIGFKPGSPDVRDSAPVALVRALLALQMSVRVADTAVYESPVPPTGFAAIDEAINDARVSACASVAEAVDGAELIVTAHVSAADAEALVVTGPKVEVLDVAGVLKKHVGAKIAAVDLLRESV